MIAVIQTKFKSAMGEQSNYLLKADTKTITNLKYYPILIITIPYATVPAYHSLSQMLQTLKFASIKRSQMTHFKGKW